MTLRKMEPRAFDVVFRKNPSVEDIMHRLERILRELWLQEFAWASIEVFASIYDLSCERMGQSGLGLC